jgi:hypothetical protein
MPGVLGRVAQGPVEADDDIDVVGAEVAPGTDVHVGAVIPFEEVGDVEGVAAAAVRA